MNTPEKRAMTIYLTLYKMIGCEAKVKTTGRYVIPMMEDGDAVLIEFNKI